MKFKEDYTQEEKQIAHDKQVNSKRKERNMYYLTDYTDKMKQNVMQWQKDHREQYRVYNRELKKRRYVERGKPKLSDKALNKRMRKVAIQNTRHFRTRGHITKQQYKEILMEIDDELIRGCQRYLDTLKERIRAIEKEKEEQRKLEEHKRIRREYWRHALYGKGRFVNLFVPSDSKLKKK
jgi:hypothetical protein